MKICCSDLFTFFPSISFGDVSKLDQARGIGGQKSVSSAKAKCLVLGSLLGSTAIEILSADPLGQMFMANEYHLHITWNIFPSFRYVKPWGPVCNISTRI